MRKYYTIEKTLHTNKESLVAMISSCVGNRKNPKPEKNFPPEKKIFLRAGTQKKKFFCGQELKKKISSSES